MAPRIGRPAWLALGASLNLWAAGQTALACNESLSPLLVIIDEKAGSALYSMSVNWVLNLDF